MTRSLAVTLGIASAAVHGHVIHTNDPPSKPPRDEEHQPPPRTETEQETR